MDLELNGKVAIVGGASKGLGRACSEVLAEEGVRVAMCARTASDLERAADEIRGATGTEIFTFAGDLDKEETIAELVAGTVERFGQLDIMVNNSMVGGRRKPTLWMPPKNCGRCRRTARCSSSRG